MPHDEHRIARLQRLAYGAATSDEERAAAEAELAALRREPRGSSGHDDPAAADAGARTIGPDATGARPDAPSAGTAAADTSAPQRRTVVRVAAVAAVAALLIGAASGWVLGSAADPSVGAGGEAPVEWTQAWQVFDRRQDDGDLVRHPPPEPDVELDDSSRRLLVTRSDGVRLVAARTADGADACLILVVPVGRPGISCTQLGRFPAEGLRAEVSARAIGEYVALWYADGRVTVNAAAVPSG
jgi:hypothetical protein